MSLKIRHGSDTKKSFWGATDGGEKEAVFLRNSLFHEINCIEIKKKEKNIFWGRK